VREYHPTGEKNQAQKRKCPNAKRFLKKMEKDFHEERNMAIYSMGHDQKN
jgi:hypothetical protein